MHGHVSEKTKMLDSKNIFYALCEGAHTRDATSTTFLEKYNGLCAGSDILLCVTCAQTDN